MNLDFFKNKQDLYKATLHLFKEQLHIKVNPLPNKVFTVKDYFKDLNNLLFENIENLYTVAIVNNHTFENQGQIEDWENNIDYKTIFIVAIDLKHELTRSKLATLTRLLNKRANTNDKGNPVIAVFRYNNKITLSSLERQARDPKDWREGEKISATKVSMLKDVEVEKPHRAHHDILAELGKHQAKTFEDLYHYWQKVLNTKALNKKFFKKIANWYFFSVAKSKFPYEYLKSDPKHKDKTNAELQELANQKATIRFITRMIFVWFLKEKGLISSDLFDAAKVSKILKKFNNKNSSDYYNAILQNLFFATLNKVKEQREFALDEGYQKNKSNYDVNSLYRYENMFQDENPENIMKLFENIPFLNGGLFDSLDNKENKEIVDGFSRNEKNQAKMPDFLFFEENELDFDEELRVIYDTKKGHYEVKGLFTIFNEYKFTIEENTPTETDVALDPYLLGEIFENLLAYYNPETGTTARKGSGSFYTPQEIVNYMVDESLKAYLNTKIPFYYKTIEANDLDITQKTELVKALSDVKILDPACGSGAFPMGVLYKMVDMLKHIDPDNSIWKQVQHDKIIGNKIAELEADKKAIEGLSDKQVKEKAAKAVEDRLNELESIFNNEYNFDDYARKLYIIQNCIYGVDIQDVAIQISKLRFFLSLIVDQKNEDIKPLPNLETKFVIANTLIGIDLPKFTVMGEDDHSQDTTKALKEELKHIREQHFKAVTRKEKLAIKQKDKEIREKIANSLADSMNSFKQEDIDKLNEEITTQKRLLAEAELMPDMVQEIIVKDLFGGESTTKVNYRKERIKECNAQIRLLENKIASLQTNTQAELIRKQALKIAQWDIYNQNAQADWFDMDWMFGVQDGFDIVIGNPPYRQCPKGIFSKEQFPYSEGKDKGKQNLYKVFVEYSYGLLKENGVSTMIVQSSLMCDISSQYTRELLLTKTKINHIIEFPKKAKTKEGQVFDNVLQGTCVYNFVKKIPDENTTFNVSIDNDATTVNKLVFEKLNQFELLKIYPNGFFIPLVKENEYNLIKSISDKSINLSAFFEYSEKGDVNLGTDKNLITNINTGIFLYRGSNSQRYNFIDNSFEFVKNSPKISSRLNRNLNNIQLLTQQITGTSDRYRLHFSISLPKSAIYGDSLRISKLKNENLNELMLSILNSTLIDWYFRKTSTNNNVNGYEIEQLPIKLPKNQQPFISLVNQILEGKKEGKDTSALEHRIDVMVYHLYGLSYDEACVIDKELKREDFEKYSI